MNINITKMLEQQTKFNAKVLHDEDDLCKVTAKSVYYVGEEVTGLVSKTNLVVDNSCDEVLLTRYIAGKFYVVRFTNDVLGVELGSWFLLQDYKFILATR